MLQAFDALLTACHHGVWGLLFNVEYVSWSCSSQCKMSKI